MIERLAIKGYRLFKDFETDLRPGINVLIGTNGSGKSTLIELLRIIQSCCLGPLPSGIERGPGGGGIFHPDAGDTMGWELTFGPGRSEGASAPACRYLMEIHGQMPPVIEREALLSPHAGSAAGAQGGSWLLRGSADRGDILRDGSAVAVHLQPNEPLLSRATDPAARESFAVRNELLRWRFHTEVQVARATRLRQPQPLGGATTLEESGANLATALLSLFTNPEYRQQRDELLSFLRCVIPEFVTLTPTLDPSGKYVLLQWRERDLDVTLSATDLSDGVLRLLILGVICCDPHPPPLICIDEPEIGLHPGLLPTVGGMLRYAAHATQMIVLTHSPELLSDMPLESIAVLRKRDGEARIVWPKDHDILSAILTHEVAGEVEVDRERLHDAFVSGEMDILE